MIERTLAKRYASALLSSAIAQKVVARIEEEILAFAHAYRAQRDLRVILEHPRIPLAGKLETLSRVLGTEAHPLLVHFLEHVTEKKRIRFIPEIAAQYDALADAFEGVVRVTVTSRSPLSAAHTKRLEARLAATTGKVIDLRAQVDAALLGGLAVRIGDRILDGSVAGRLKATKESLLLAHD
ncbi:MAG: ATP synthase F1 subunit delta [Planctomycetes bacterium]|nr:ATP synthase F1 subunit delta [Planctomycetota bacterium]